MGLRFIRLLPRRTVSRTLGVLGRLRLPGLLLRPVLKSYIGHFGVDLSEAERPLEGYSSFNDFFTRALKPGARPLDPDASAILSPVDGRVYASGRVEGGTILQAKGVPYSVADFLGSEDDAKAYEGGSFVTFYLSPRDYHRIHWPFDAAVLRVRHLPGDLWPVNDAAVAGVPGLFARNERAPVFGTTARGAPFAMTPVGALNVGSIRLTFHDLCTNRTGCWTPTTFPLAPPLLASRGIEFGCFDFGSAVVLLLSTGAGRLDELPAGLSVRVGRRIGALASR